MTAYTVKIQYDIREGDYYIPLPEEMLSVIAELGWNVNEELEWIDNKNGTFTIQKKEERDE
jgi:hypothetical protein